MTSEERREARYRRRVEARAAGKRAVSDRCGRFENVFTYANLYRAYKCSRLGVAWKASVQKYIINAPLNVFRTCRQLEAGEFRSPGFFEFDLYERGKFRHIRSTGITERVVQRCLCDNALVPVLGRTFIYDNGASMKNKGYSFSMRRLVCHLQRHYRKHGTNGYVLLFDFSRFFDNVSHALIKGELRSQFSDGRIVRLTEHFIDAFGDIGVGLGSQISQVFALASANRLDHYIKEALGIRGYGRYMDDGYLIHHSKQYLIHCLEKIRAICGELGIALNEKKTQIVKLRRGFTWLKARVFLTGTGRVVMKIYRRSVTRMRRKLKTLSRKLDEGKVAFPYIWAAWQSWRSYAAQFDAWHTVQNMGNLFDELFIARWMNEGSYV